MNSLLRAARMSPSLLGRFVIVLMVAVGLIGATSVAAAPARASVATGVGISPARPSVSAGAGLRAVRIAATRRGARYQWGAVGPRRFDCSGLTMWVYARMGNACPHRCPAVRRHQAHPVLGPPPRRPGLLQDRIGLRPPRGDLRGCRHVLARTAHRRPCAARPADDPDRLVRPGAVTTRPPPTHSSGRSPRDLHAGQGVLAAGWSDQPAGVGRRRPPHRQGSPP